MRERLLQAMADVNTTDLEVVEDTISFLYSFEDLNGVSFDEYEELIQHGALSHNATFLQRSCNNQGHELSEELFIRLGKRFPHWSRKTYESGWCEYHLQKGLEGNQGRPDNL